jgi:hypothetical protein
MWIFSDLGACCDRELCEYAKKSPAWGEAPFSNDHHTPGPRPIAEGQGFRIGQYKRLRRIGEEGMGAVYMGAQERPVPGCKRPGDRRTGLHPRQPSPDVRRPKRLRASLGRCRRPPGLRQ